jgi:hypothetical protein
MPSHDTPGGSVAIDHLKQLTRDLQDAAKELDALSVRLAELPADVIALLMKEIVFPGNLAISGADLAGHQNSDDQERDQPPK